MKVRLGYSYVRIQASDGCKSAFEVAPLLEGSKPTAHRSRDVGMSSCTNENNKKLTSRTEEIRRQNIRLNSCSFTLKERPDSDDMVRQKSSKKQRKSLAGDAEMLTFCKVRDRGSISGVPTATCVGMLRYSITTTRKVKDLCSPRGAKKKVFLGTSSTVTLLEKNHARNVGQF